MSEDGRRVYRVYWKGEHPKKKCVYFPGEFDKRKKAVHWCRNHRFEHEGLVIVHPDGTEEPYRDEYTEN